MSSASSHFRSSEGLADAGLGSIGIGLIAIALFFGGFLSWAALTPLDAAVSASGVVVVSGNRQTVQHREGGIVDRLHVTEGVRVEAGEVLVELATTELKSQERSLIGRVIELETLRTRLAAELAGDEELLRPFALSGLPGEYLDTVDRVLAQQASEMRARRDALNAQLDVLRQRETQIVARIAGYEQQMESTRVQSALIAEELEGVSSLAADGLVPMTRVRALEREQAALTGSHGQLAADIEEAREAIGEARLQAISLEQNAAQAIASQLRQTDTTLAELTPQVEAIRSQLERSLIRAPVSGAVVGLRVFTQGGVIRPGDTILDIVPEAQPLVLEAQVDPADADDLVIGQRTQVRVTSFGLRNMPIVYGEVTRISADRFVDERTGRAYFVAEVVVPTTELERLEAAGASGLRAGLSVEVIVPLRARTALEYLVEPLRMSLWRSLGEG
jgi:HlyD family secretion protein